MSEIFSKLTPFLIFDKIIILLTFVISHGIASLDEIFGVPNFVSHFYFFTSIFHINRFLIIAIGSSILLVIITLFVVYFVLQFIDKEKAELCAEQR